MSVYERVRESVKECTEKVCMKHDSHGGLSSLAKLPATSILFGNCFGHLQSKSKACSNKRKRECTHATFANKKKECSATFLHLKRNNKTQKKKTEKEILIHKKIKSHKFQE